jgi:glycosyltransferase involved in cell wall biosynthesis
MKKRVALISNQAFSLVNFRGDLIKKLVLSGCQVFALAPDFTQENRRALDVLGAQVVEIPLTRTGMHPMREAYNTLLLVFILRRIQPQVILGYTIKPVIFGTVAAWLARIPRRVAMIEGLGYVFTPDNEQVSVSRRALNVLVRSLYWFSLKLASTVIFLNREDANEFIVSKLVKESKVNVLGGIGVDLSHWKCTPPPRGQICFVMVARLLREKGIYEYAAAAKTVKEQYPNAVFVLLGDLDVNPGSLKKEDINGWVAAGLLVWPGHVDVKPWLEQASVFVLPSYREGVPRSTQEAMAIGRAVITTDVPGCRETVVDGVNGFLVPARDADALAAAMLKFIIDPSLISAMGPESRRMAQDRFDVNEVNGRLISALGLS